MEIEVTHEYLVSNGEKKDERIKIVKRIGGIGGFVSLVSLTLEEAKEVSIQLTEKLKNL